MRQTKEFNLLDPNMKVVKREMFVASAAWNPHQKIFNSENHLIYQKIFSETGSDCRNESTTLSEATNV